MRRGITLVAIAFVLPACDLPFGLSLARTPDLLNGAATQLATASTFEVTGAYTVAGSPWLIDVQVVRPNTEHVKVNEKGIDLEGIQIGARAYFRGQAFLAQQLGSAPNVTNLVKAVGDRWWTSGSSTPPDFSAFTDPTRIKADFLNTLLVTRKDHLLVEGTDTAELSDPQQDLYVQEVSPHRLVRLHLKTGSTVAGISNGNIDFTNYGKDFGIVPPPEVIDFNNLSTLPPNYTVLSVDTSGCGISTCVVAAKVQNLGGTTGAMAPSTVSFAVVDTGSGKAIGNCVATVSPDLAYNATGVVSCVVPGVSAASFVSAQVTATPTNPAYL
ncbi:MAG TPA: hypothetical protein VG015_03265 [Candidatus Dormibacteraeota bacterium]|jgi:hypothetical protein|nr:hypothetical protein [Candidatus Dormibacteraeota bacterium]